METSFLWFGVFSGSFGVRSIALCKCSGKVLIGYINLYKTYKIERKKVLASAAKAKVTAR